MIRNLMILLLVGGPSFCFAVRIKDIANIEGVRDNQLVGYGLIVGLNGTGDKSADLSSESLKRIVQNIGVPIKSEFDSKNVAAVVVTANLEPFTNVGTKIPIHLASIGSASSLEGGTLLMTPLKGADGKIYAMAQGNVPPSAYQSGGGAAGSASKNKGVSAQIPRGAILEKAVDFDISKLRQIRYQLHSPDFTTAARMAHKINENLGAHYASALDAGTVEVLFPIGFDGNLVELVAQVEGVSIEADNRAKVVVNPATGTVILGQHVSISPVAIAHNNLRIEVAKTPLAPPAPPVAPQMPGDLKEILTNSDDKGGTRDLSSSPLVDETLLARPPAPRSQEDEEPIKHSVFVTPHTASIADVAESLNALGASPQDLITILNSLKASGALMAELEVQ